MRNVLLSFVFIFQLSSLNAQPLSLDQSFDLNFNFYGGFTSMGRLSSYLEMDNGDLIVGGGFYFTKNNKEYGDMIRISQDGTLDETFNHIVYLSSVGTIINRGDSLLALRFASRLFYDFDGGYLLNSWYYNSMEDIDDMIEDIEFFDDNSAFLCGGNMLYYPDTTHQTRFNLARLNPDGHVDTTFNHDTDNCIWNIVKYDSNRVFLSGKFTKYDSIYTGRLCRVYNDGTLDTTFHTNVVQGEALPLFVQNDGKIIVGDIFWLEGDNIITGPNGTGRSLMRLLPNGDIDSTFNPVVLKGNHEFKTTIMCPTYDGGYLLGGTFTHYNGHPRRNIAKIDYNGFLDTTAFTGTGFDSCYTTNERSWIRILTQGPNDTYYVGGNFDRYNGQTVQPLIRLHNEYYGLDIPETNQNRFELYPNPAQDRINIRSSNIIEEIQIYNSEGELLQILNPNIKEEKIDVSGLPPGYYFIRTFGREEVFVKRFVVVR